MVLSSSDILAWLGSAEYVCALSINIFLSVVEVSWLSKKDSVLDMWHIHMLVAGRLGDVVLSMLVAGKVRDYGLFGLLSLSLLFKSYHSQI